MTKAPFTAHGTVFDIGLSTSKALSRLKAGNENGNGSLMRIAPLVFYLTGRPEAERFSITKIASSITHAHLWSVAACYIYLEYLWKLLGGMEKRVAYAEVRGDFSERYPRIDADTLAVCCASRIRSQKIGI
jgi:ADP-ribosylglycohydrolase